MIISLQSATDLKEKAKQCLILLQMDICFHSFNKAGEIGIRFSKEIQKKYIEEFDSSIYKSYNSIMHGYVLIPEKMLEDLDNLAKYLDESYDYVMSLDPK